MKLNDLNPYPLGPAPKTGPALNLFADPAFGTPILRVTDENDAAGVNFANAYSAIWDTFNTDSTRFIYYGFDGSGWTADLDCVAKKVTNKRRLAKLASNNAAYWSRLNPDILYLIEGWQAANLWRYHFSTDTWELIADLSKHLPALAPGTTWVGSRGMSWDDNRFHISCPAITSTFIYDVKLAKLIGPFTLAQALATGWAAGVDAATQTANFNKSTMDSDGAVLWTADTQFIYNVEAGTSFLPKFGVPGNYYGDVHADAGLENIIASLGGLGAASPAGVEGMYPLVLGLNPANLATYLSPRRQIGPRILWGLDSHNSYRDKSGQWATFNLDGAPFGGDVGAVSPFGNQDVFQLSVSGPADGSVNRRICQTYSNPADFDSSMWYSVQPHFSAAQDNRAGAYNSSYANKRIDVYLAFMEEPTPPKPTDDTLCGVQFTHDEAQLLKTFAQWQLATRPKPVL